MELLSPALPHRPTGLPVTVLELMTYLLSQAWFHLRDPLCKGLCPGVGSAKGQEANLESSPGTRLAEVSTPISRASGCSTWFP